MAKFTIKFLKPSNETGDFEDYFGMTYPEFLELSDEEREEAEQRVTDSFRDQTFIGIDKIEYEEDENEDDAE